MGFIFCSIANSLALLTAEYFLANVSFTGNNLLPVLIAGLVLALANTILKPLLKILSFPFILLSFGLFSFLISMGMLWTTDQLMPELTIKGFPALFLTTLIVGVFNLLSSGLKN
ncbi:MAG: phage holin family protein [bacterium]